MFLSRSVLGRRPTRRGTGDAGEISPPEIVYFYRRPPARQGTGAQDNDYMVVVVHGDLA